MKKLLYLILPFFFLIACKKKVETQPPANNNVTVNNGIKQATPSLNSSSVYGGLDKLTADGNLLINCYTNSGGQAMRTVVKMDTLGNILWKKNISVRPSVIYNIKTFAELDIHQLYEFQANQYVVCDYSNILIFDAQGNTLNTINIPQKSGYNISTLCARKVQGNYYVVVTYHLATNASVAVFKLLQYDLNWNIVNETEKAILPYFGGDIGMNNEYIVEISDSIPGTLPNGERYKKALFYDYNLNLIDSVRLSSNFIGLRMIKDKTLLTITLINGGGGIGGFSGISYRFTNGQNGVLNSGFDIEYTDAGLYIQLNNGNYIGWSTRNMNGNGLIEPLPSNSPRVYTESLAPNYTSSIINYAYNDSTFLSQFSATDYIRPVFGVPNNSDNIFYLVCSYNGNIGLMKINKQTEYLNW